MDSLHAEGGALCHRYRFFNYSQRLMKNHIKEHGQVKVFGEERTPQCDGGGARRPLPAGWDAYPAWRGLAPTSQFAEQPLYRAHATEALSMPLTCLLGLQHFYPPDAALWGKESLTIHVVGAGAFEYRGRAFWEELLHVMPQLKTINVALMGPEMADIVRGESDGHSDGHYPATNMTCCDACKARACKYVIAIHGKLPQFQPFLLFSMRPASTRAALIFTCSPSPHRRDVRGLPGLGGALRCHRRRGGPDGGLQLRHPLQGGLERCQAAAAGAVAAGPGGAAAPRHALPLHELGPGAKIYTHRLCSLV